jgi:hypothetical protein
MNKFWRAMNSRLTSSLVATLIKLALCFSVGEGLRLSPFPVPTFLRTEYAQLSVTNAPDKTSFSQYGPLDVPAQSQKRNKRQVVNLAGPATAESQDLIPETLGFSGTDLLDAVSSASVPRPAGRAPPSLF